MSEHATVSDQPLPSTEPDSDHAYPSEWLYIKVALILGAITAVEVAVYYVTGLRKALPPILILLSAIKFSLVAMYFMHLRHDSKIFRRLFVVGIVLAIGVYLIALSSLHVFSR